MTIKNISAQPIRGPVSLVVNLSGDATLWNAHGRTCVTKPVGLEFITLPMPADVLRPQDALEITLQFRSAEMEPIEFSTKILASPGER